MQLMTMEDNLRFNKKLTGLTEYLRIDNYNALEIPYAEVIPSDYNGIMGVPISFMDKYCPEQFEILGTEADLNIEKGRGYINGQRMYSRIFIRKKQ